MDAATLYMMTMLPNGEQGPQPKSSQTFPLRRKLIGFDGRIPNLPKPRDTVEYRCEAHLPIFLLANHQRGRSRHLLNFTSLQGCTAYRWLVHMRDRRSTAHCYEWARILNAANREGEEDRMDMLGLPGLKRPPR